MKVSSLDAHDSVLADQFLYYVGYYHDYVDMYEITHSSVSVSRMFKQWASTYPDAKHLVMRGKLTSDGETVLADIRYKIEQAVHSMLDELFFIR